MLNLPPVHGPGEKLPGYSIARPPAPASTSHIYIVFPRSFFLPSTPLFLLFGPQKRMFYPVAVARTKLTVLARRFARLTHVSPDGLLPCMVDVGGKSVTRRTAQARAVVELPPAVLDALRGCGWSEEDETNNGAAQAADSDVKAFHATASDVFGPKGPVFATAVIAGVMGAKKTSDLIPFCHQLNLNKCDIKLNFSRGGSAIEIYSEVSVEGKTGVEMEALTAVSVASLCVYDMLKALSHDIRIIDISLVSKTGGKSTLQNNRHGNTAA